MKKVLILAYDFPPYVSVGGLRPYSWYKYFHEYDIYPVVVTRQWDNKYGNHLDYIAAGESNNTIIEETEFGTIIRTPYKPNLSNRLLLKYGVNKFKLIRKSITAYYELMQFLFFVGTKSGLYYGAKEYLKNNEVDLIIGTGEPFILFKYASKLSKKFNVPWIADYRDPWTQNKSRSSNILKQRFNSFFEKKYVNTSSCFTTVSEFFSNSIKLLVPNKSFHIIENGFDSEKINDNKDIAQNSETMCVAFVGTIYSWHPLEEFIETYLQFSKNKQNVQLNFYGINNPERLTAILPPNYKDKIKIYAKLDNNKLISELYKNNIMLLFNYYHVIGTKIYDYLAIKRKILFCFSEQETKYHCKYPYSVKQTKGINSHLQENLLKKTNAGIVVKNSKHLLLTLDELYAEFEENRSIDCNSIGIEKYSRKHQASKMSDIIKSI